MPTPALHPADARLAAALSDYRNADPLWLAAKRIEEWATARAVRERAEAKRGAA